jgi:hypothetical protein
MMQLPTSPAMMDTSSPRRPGQTFSKGISNTITGASWVRRSSLYVTQMPSSSYTVLQPCAQPLYVRINSVSNIASRRCVGIRHVVPEHSRYCLESLVMSTSCCGWGRARHRVHPLIPATDIHSATTIIFTHDHGRSNREACLMYETPKYLLFGFMSHTECLGTDRLGSPQRRRVMNVVNCYSRAFPSFLPAAIWHLQPLTSRK